MAMTTTTTTTTTTSMTTPTPGRKCILCFHGKFQSGEMLSNKIGGARRKLKAYYDLEFLDGPIGLGDNQQFAWWLKNEQEQHTLIPGAAFDYVLQQTKGKQYDALLGFSQGGTLATALAVSGVLGPGIQAVVTAGSPGTEEAFAVAQQLCGGGESGKKIPKLHFAGQNDTMVPVESTRALCELGGNGELIVHEKGHLFPTKAVHTNYMVEFLAKAFEENEENTQEE